MAYDHKKRKIRKHRQPDRVAMAKRKRNRKKAERAHFDAENRLREQRRQIDERMARIAKMNGRKGVRPARRRTI